MPSSEPPTLRPEEYFELVEAQRLLLKKMNSGTLNALQLKPDHVRLSAITSQIERHQKTSLAFHEQDLKQH
jgi:serine/threonine protein kinase HipA of HipAB toxin-antitoxin module